MSHAMVTNKSAIPSFVMSRSIKSRKVPFTQFSQLHIVPEKLSEILEFLSQKLREKKQRKENKKQREN